MKKLIYIATIVFLATSAYGQTEELFKVKGAAKLISTWTSKTPNDTSGTLASGDKISFETIQSSIIVRVIHNKFSKWLVGLSDENAIVKVYEYDFDNDGQNEIIIIYSPGYTIVTIEVFRYSGGLAERVGNFAGQFEIVLDKNTISMPFGSQGIPDEYLYRDGVFYNLVQHDPNKIDH
mgnify:CR=1 FL=1